MLKLVVVFSLLAASLAAPQFQQGLGLSLGFPQQFALQQQAAVSQQVQQQQQQPPAVQHVSVQPTSLIPAINPVNFISTASLDGSSAHGFQTIDGQVQQETIGADGSRRGRYSYLDANGQQVVVEYVADQHGYRSTNDPVSISRGTLAPPPTTTTPRPLIQQNPLAHLFPAQGASLNHFGFQPLVAQPQAQQSAQLPIQFTLTGRR